MLALLCMFLCVCFGLELHANEVTSKRAIVVGASVGMGGRYVKCLQQTGILLA